jgi:hypothetical protein
LYQCALDHRLAVAHRPLTRSPPADHLRITCGLLASHPPVPGAAYDVEPAELPRFAPSTAKEGTLARAKQTGRAEARRRYRQAQADVPDLAEEGTDTEEPPERPTARSAAQPRKAASADARPATGRMGVTSAFRAAYHPVHLREDIAALPSILFSPAFLFGVGALTLGVMIAVAFRDYTGGLFALQLVVAPGSALLPQLVAGFFARRGSYILGLLIGLLQGIVFLVLLNLSLNGDGPLRLGGDFTQAMYDQALRTSFVEGPITSMLFAAGAAWYRRFLALSSPRTSGSRPAGRASAKSTPSRRPPGR